MNATTCKNCEHIFDGSFCNNCGQKLGNTRIDSRYLIGEISNSLLQMNSGFFYTLKELFVRPGSSIRGFLEGKRKQYFKPLAFLLLTSTLYVFIAFTLGFNTVSEDFLTGFTSYSSSSESREPTSILIVLNWLVNNHAYAMLLVLPSFSLASYIAFFKFKYNYFEHLVLNIYITGQQMFIYLILGIVVIENNSTESIPFLCSVIFNFWAFYTFFQSKKPFIKILLTLLTYVLFLLVQVILLLVVGKLLLS